MDAQTVRTLRNDARNNARVISSLHDQIDETIKGWTDPEQSAYLRITTRNLYAAATVLRRLRAVGFWADFHWHGHSGDPFHLEISLDKPATNNTLRDDRRFRSDWGSLVFRLVVLGFDDLV